MIPLAMFWLWQGFRRKANLLSINRMEAGDTQRGKGGLFSLGGTGSRDLRVWNLALALLYYLLGGSLIVNDLLPLRYWACQKVGGRRSRAQSAN